MQIQTTVTIDRNWQREFEKDDAIIEMRVAIHVAIDPITGTKECRIFTDDGHGNGDAVLSFDMT